jgi:hypothetical protein
MDFQQIFVVEKATTLCWRLCIKANTSKGHSECRLEEESRSHLPSPGSPAEGPGANYVAYVSVFLRSIIICGPYKLTLPDQAQVTMRLTLSISDLV